MWCQYTVARWDRKLIINNNNRIHRCNSRFLTSSSLRSKPSPTHKAQVARAHSYANLLQHIGHLSCATCRVTCHMVRRDSSAIYNNNNNNNRIQRRYTRFFTISSQCRKLSPTCTLKWPGRNRVQITCNTSNAYLVQVSCYVPHGTKGQLSY